MKKLFYALLLFFSAAETRACDICGCGPGAAYLGILPGFQHRFVGLRYQQNSLQTHLTAGASSYLSSMEYYRSMEVWGATQLGKRFRVMTLIPYNFMERRNQEETASRKGLGDISILGYYQLLKREHTTRQHQLLIQSLWLGAGIKLPTGHFESGPDEQDAGSSQNRFQLGSGSLDFSAQMMYDLRLQDAGINLNLLYKITRANKEEYQYGNKLTANLLAYYKLRLWHELTVAPNAGLLIERAAKDQLGRGVMVWESGGYLNMGVLGAELNWGKFSSGINYQLPLSQRLGENKVEARSRMMVHLSIGW